MFLSVLQRNCLTVKKYIDGPLGHYVVNVTSAARLCSKALCQKNGRCVRKSLASGGHLHLSQRSFHIHRRLQTSRPPDPQTSGPPDPWTPRPRFHVSGHLSHRDILDMKNRFCCQCYQGWTGVHCEMPQATPPDSIPLPRPCEGGLLRNFLFLLSNHFPCLFIITSLGLCLILRCLIL